MIEPSGTVTSAAFDVTRDVARLHRRGRFVAQDLLDRQRDQRRVLHDLSALIGVLGQQLAHETDQTRRRLVAGAGDHADVEQDLGARQPAGPVFILELGVEQLRHQIVGGMFYPPIDVVGEHLMAVLEEILGDRPERALLERDLAAAAVTDLLLVFFGDAQEVADRAHRDHRADVLDEVEPPRAHQRIERTHTEVPGERLDRLHPARRENP